MSSSSYEARLAAFADGRRLVRLRHPVTNRDAVACDACGSSEPRRLHVLKDDASGQYFFAGSNCLQALTELGLIRRRYAADLAEHAYAEERARRHAEQELPASAAERSVDDATVAAPQSEPSADSPALVAAVVVLQPGDWATLLQALPLGADRWRFITIGDHPLESRDLGQHGAYRSGVSG